MIQRGYSARLFLFESPQQVGIVGDGGRQDLDGDVAFPPGIAGAGCRLAHDHRQAGDDLIRSQSEQTGGDDVSGRRLAAESDHLGETDAEQGRIEVLVQRRVSLLVLAVAADEACRRNSCGW